ncbi:MAG: M23 family metallopeptidase [Bacilli bacterium]|nr:M23 family metallopeptidase [Bacilli bacterium]
MAKKYIKSFVVKCLVCVILFLVISIICNFSNTNLLWFKNNIYNNSIDFSFFNKIYNKYIDKYLPFDIYEEKIVMSDGLIYESSEKYLDGVSLKVGDNYNISSLCGGIVVYIGNKDNLGNTVIIQGTDGVDYWYSNISNLSVNLYDYIEKDVLIGTSSGEKIYLTFIKDGEYLNYEDFI